MNFGYSFWQHTHIYDFYTNVEDIICAIMNLRTIYNINKIIIDSVEEISSALYKRLEKISVEINCNVILLYDIVNDKNKEEDKRQDKLLKIEKLLDYMDKKWHSGSKYAVQNVKGKNRYLKFYLKDNKCKQWLNVAELRVFNEDNKIYSLLDIKKSKRIVGDYYQINKHLELLDINIG